MCHLHQISTNGTIQSQPEDIGSFLNSPYLITFVILLCGLLQGIFSQATAHMSTLAGIRAKNAILVLLYEKVLKLPITNKKETGSEPQDEPNESNLDIGHITNLATEDVSNVKEIFWNFHYLWALPLKMLVIGILIHHKIGLSGSLGTLCGVILIIPLQLLVGKIMSDNNKNLQVQGDKRILLASETIQGMKTVKLNCLESLKLEQIHSVRKEELKCLNKDSFLWSCMTFLASISTLLVSALVIGLYGLLESKPFTSEDIFTTIALLNQLTVCLSVFPVTLPIYIKGILSMKRLKHFFSLKNETEDVFYENELNEEALVMKKAVFVWPQGEETACQVNQLAIKKGSLTIMKAEESNPFFLSLLKETKLRSGSFEWNLGNSVAFVGSRPWIINGSVKENILMGRPFKEKRYKKVLTACDLEADLNILPMKDDTEVGEDGVLLSGGQRQRIAIARCLYSKANCTILDNPLTALDSNLALHIFEHGILNILLKRKRTVFMSCERKDFWPRADIILDFNQGVLEHQGNYHEMKRLNPSLFRDTKRPGTMDGKTAQERWKLLRNVTKFSMGVKTKSKPVKPMMCPKKTFNRPFKRLESSAQLGFCHNVMIHSPLMEEEQESTQSFLKHCRSTKTGTKKPADLARMAMQNEQKKNKKIELNAQDSMIGFQFAHRFVSRMTSNTSQLSGVSGFSDDDRQDDDFEHDGLMTNHDGSWEEEDREKGNIASKIIQTYFKAGGISNLIFFLLFSIGFQALKIFSDFLLKEPQDNFMVQYLTFASSAVLLSIGANVFGQNLGAQARKNLHQMLLTNVMKIKPYLFEMLPSSRFISRFTQDTFIIDQKLPSCLQRLTLVTFICIGAVTVNAIQSHIFLAFAIPLIIIYWLIQHFYRRTSRELQRIESSTRSPYLSHVNNTLCSLVTLRAFREQQRCTNQFCDHLDANTTALLLTQSGSRWLGVTLDMAGSFIVFASVISCLINQEVQSIGLALNYSLLVPIYLAWVIKFLTDLESCLNAVERVIEYTDLEHEDVEEDTEEVAFDSCEIEFCNVSLSHGDDIRPVVHHINLRVPQGQRLAIVGRSGSGKSTIVGCLSGMSSVVHGVVKVSEVEIDKIKIRNLRHLIKTIPQDVHTFQGTIKDNLDPKNQHESSVINQVLDDLSVHVQDLEQSINSFGDNLSKGRKQELALVQAVLGNPQVLVLDEATSAMDDDRLIITKLFKLCRSRNVTLISVVHRLTNITEYDRILVIGDGRILEDGKPLELLKKPMGFFSALYRNSTCSF